MTPPPAGVRSRDAPLELRLSSKPFYVADVTEFNDDEMLAAIARWSRDDRQQRAIGSRMSSAIHRQLAQEEATFSGLLQDLVERQPIAHLLLSSGRKLMGALTAVGRDFCAVTTDAGHTTLIATRALAGVEIEGNPRNFPTPSERSSTENSPGFTDVLAELAAEQRMVRFTVRDQPTTQEGQVLSVGVDVCMFGKGSPISRIAFIPLEQIDDIALG